MRFKSPIVGAVSGSIGGTTYAHNAGGMYMRARATPTDPGTTYQIAIRAYVAGLVNFWVCTLTQAQRDAWEVYATQVPLPDVFGDPRYRSGINHYVRSNVPRLQYGLTRKDDAPTIFNLGEYSVPTIVASEGPQHITVTFNPADAWCDEDGSYLLVWCSRPQNASINFFKGPYRKVYYIAGSSSDPPVDPVPMTAPFAFTAGQKLYVRYNVVRADGRLGPSMRGFCLAGA